MKRNIGTMERIVRVTLGIAVLFYFGAMLHSPWAWLGVIPLITGIMGYSVLYGIFHMSSSKYS